MKYPQPYSYILRTLRTYEDLLKETATKPEFQDQSYTKGFETIAEKLSKEGEDPKTFTDLCTNLAKKYYNTYADENTMDYIEFYNTDAGIRRAAKILKNKYPTLQDICEIEKKDFVPKMRKMHIGLSTCILILELMQKQNLMLKNCDQNEMNDFISILQSTL